MVALARTLQDLAVGSRALVARFRDLQISVVEDLPANVDLALLSHRGQALEDLVMGATELSNTVGAATTLHNHGEDREARRRLVITQELLNHAGRRFESEVAGYRAMAEVELLARQRGREWAAWLRAFCRSLDECQRALHVAHAALLECWRDLADVGPVAGPTERDVRGGGGLTLLGRQEGEGHDGIK
jgi:hypothetical protein